MIRVDKFYDCLLRNRLPNGRIYVKEEENSLTTKLSKILNNEIYTTYRNQKCFASQQRPTIIARWMREKFKFKPSRKRIPKRRLSKRRSKTPHEFTDKPSIENLSAWNFATEKILK